MEIAKQKGGVKRRKKAYNARQSIIAIRQINS